MSDLLTAGTCFLAVSAAGVAVFELFRRDANIRILAGFLEIGV